MYLIKLSILFEQLVRGLEDAMQKAQVHRFFEALGPEGDDQQKGHASLSTGIRRHRRCNSHACTPASLWRTSEGKALSGLDSF
jgi:hypothetical protein